MNVANRHLMHLASRPQAPPWTLNYHGDTHLVMISIARNVVSWLIPKD